METVSLLKAIAIWRKQLIADLPSHYSQVDRHSLHQIAQEIISQAITLQICHDHAIASNLQLVQLHSGIDEKMLESAIQHLYTLKDSYRISVLPIELLGQTHEQFWMTHQSMDRKAQGVYYTPVAIVDYMIEHTVGTLLQDKTVTELNNTNFPLRILDPACGSGVFLLRAYQFLLNWYHTQYVARLSQYQQRLYLNSKGDWQLTIAEKQQILLRHIYGLDINQQSVQVAKRSLLLQMLVGNVEENQVQNFSNRLLDISLLNANLQCGNALVDLDFYDENEQTQLIPDEVNQVKAFSWSNAFPSIVGATGFEVVIGNPPWVFTRNVNFSDRLKHYYQTKYLKPLELARQGKAKQMGKVNLFVLFLFKFIELMHKQGRIGIILPNTLLRTTGYRTARKYVLDRCNIEQIVDLGCETFLGVTASSIVLILGKSLENSTVKFISNVDRINMPTLLNKTSFLKNKDYVFSIFRDQPQSDLFQKMDAISIPLNSLTTEIIEGIVCRKDQIKRSYEQQIQSQKLQIQELQTQELQPQSDRYQKLLEGKDISRYCITFREKYILFDRKQLHRPRPDYVWYAAEKIILRRIGGGEFALVGALDTDQYYAFASTNNILLNSAYSYNIRYVLALLNSRLLNYYYIQNFTNRSRLTVNISKTSLEQLPIRSINFNCSYETMQHDRLVVQVDYLQRLNRQFLFTTNSLERQDLQHKIEAIDQQIDQWVYELYGLTKAEIALITSSPDSKCP